MPALRSAARACGTLCGTSTSPLAGVAVAPPGEGAAASGRAAAAIGDTPAGTATPAATEADSARAAAALTRLRLSDKYAGALLVVVIAISAAAAVPLLLVLGLAYAAAAAGVERQGLREFRGAPPMLGRGLEAIAGLLLPLGVLMHSCFSVGLFSAASATPDGETCVRWAIAGLAINVAASVVALVWLLTKAELAPQVSTLHCLLR